jgi:hypothetical protein
MVEAKATKIATGMILSVLKYSLDKKAVEGLTPPRMPP